jgi:hypothetical protein
MKAVHLFVGLPFELHSIIASYLYDRPTIEHLRLALCCSKEIEKDAAVYALAAYCRRSVYLTPKAIEGQWHEYETVSFDTRGDRLNMRLFGLGYTEAMSWPGGLPARVYMSAYNTTSQTLSPITETKPYVRGAIVRSRPGADYEILDPGGALIVTVPYNCVEHPPAATFNVSPDASVIIADGVIMQRNEKAHGGWVGVQRLPHALFHSAQKAVFANDSSALAIVHDHNIAVCDMRARIFRAVQETGRIGGRVEATFSPSGKYIVVTSTHPQALVVYLRDTLQKLCGVELGFHPVCQERLQPIFRPGEDEYFYLPHHPGLLSKRVTATGELLLSVAFAPSGQKTIALPRSQLLVALIQYAGFYLYRDTGSDLVSLHHIRQPTPVSDFEVDTHGNLYYATMTTTPPDFSLIGVKRVALY